MDRIGRKPNIHAFAMLSASSIVALSTTERWSNWPMDVLIFLRRKTSKPSGGSAADLGWSFRMSQNHSRAPGPWSSIAASSALQGSSEEKHGSILVRCSSKTLRADAVVASTGRSSKAPVGATGAGGRGRGGGCAAAGSNVAVGSAAESTACRDGGRSSGARRVPVPAALGEGAVGTPPCCMRVCTDSRRITSSALRILRSREDCSGSTAFRGSPCDCLRACSVGVIWLVGAEADSRVEGTTKNGSDLGEKLRTSPKGLSASQRVSSFIFSR
mmetsp:Transcript_97243/g.314024  ORF Transcript_97243/g.314024 Transcript_97243/m.314024 type:complete len:272 (+) Transcript_97243:184-999(+)